jgi:receptor protein-tyrosine kinase
MSLVTGRNAKPSRFARLLANLRERWWLILCTTVVAGGLVFGVSLLLAPRYSASTQLVYAARDAQLASQALSASGTAGLVQNVSSDALTLQTSAFADRVSQAMGGGRSSDELRSSIEVVADPALDAIEITASGSDPDEAAAIANAFAAEFVTARQQQTEDLLSEARGLIEARLASLTAEEAASSYGLALKQQKDDLEMLLSMQVSDYQVLEQAVPPAAAYYPRPFRNLLIGLGAGLAFGLLLALLLGQLDRRIKDPATLESVMELPVLGAMPATSRRGGRGSVVASGAVGFRRANEPLLESMRMLRSNLKLLGFGETKRSVLITSTAPGEGKSTLAVNLALVMALSGDRVILVDADLRNPAIHTFLGIPNDKGLGEMLTDRAIPWSTQIQAVDLAPFVDPEISPVRKTSDGQPVVTKFVCLTSGTFHGDPAEVLESGALMDMLAELEGISDYVILDGPPMLSTSDSLILAQSVDAVIFASTLGKETAAEAAQARQLLARAEIVPWGIVICGARPQALEGYYYHRPTQDGGTGPRRS